MNTVKFIEKLQTTIVCILIVTFGVSFLALANLAWKNYVEDSKELNRSY